MKIALINENSQNSKNPMIEAALRKVVEPMGHTVYNYGMYAAEGSAPLTYVQNGILCAVLINSGAADYVVTGCGTGEGAMLAIAQITKRKFSSVKLVFDISMMVVSLVTCLLVLGSLGSVGVGTVIAAVLVGSELKVLNKVLGAARARILAIGLVETEVPEAGAASAELTPLQQIMQRDVYTVREDASYLDALRFLSEKKISGAPVVNAAGDLVGFISDGDILRRLASEHSPFVNAGAFGKTDFNDKLSSVMSIRISEIAVKNVITVDASDDLSEVCYKLAENHLKKAPVMCNGRMVGVVNRSNITDYAAGLIAA